VWNKKKIWSPNPPPPNKAITLRKTIQQHILLVTSSHKHKCTPCLQLRVGIIFICQRIKFVPSSRTISSVFLLSVIKQVFNHSLKATYYFASSEQYLETAFLPHRKHNMYFVLSVDMSCAPSSFSRTWNEEMGQYVLSTEFIIWAMLHMLQLKLFIKKEVN